MVDAEVQNQFTMKSLSLNTIQSGRCWNTEPVTIKSLSLNTEPQLQTLKYRTSLRWDRCRWTRNYSDRRWNTEPVYDEINEIISTVFVTHRTKRAADRCRTASGCKRTPQWGTRESGSPSPTKIPTNECAVKMSIIPRSVADLGLPARGAQTL